MNWLKSTLEGCSKPATPNAIHEVPQSSALGRGYESWKRPSTNQCSAIGWPHTGQVVFTLLYAFVATLVVPREPT